LFGHFGGDSTNPVGTGRDDLPHKAPSYVGKDCEMTHEIHPNRSQMNRFLHDSLWLGHAEKTFKPKIAGPW